MTERPNFGAEPVSKETSAEHFQDNLLWAAFKRCVEDPEDNYDADTSRNDKIETRDGEVDVKFESLYDDATGNRIYYVVTEETKSQLFTELPVDELYIVLQKAKEIIIKDSFDEDESYDEIDIENALSRNYHWRQFSDPEQLKYVSFTVKSGWVFRVVNGQAAKEFYAEQSLGGLHMGWGNVGEIDGENDPADTDDNETIATLYDMAEDLSKVTDEDLEMLQGLLQKLGLITDEDLKNYRHSTSQ